MQHGCVNTIALLLPMKRNLAYTLAVWLLPKSLASLADHSSIVNKLQIVDPTCLSSKREVHCQRTIVE
jgi:hypothetical protein